MPLTLKDCAEIEAAVQTYVSGSCTSGAAAKPAFHDKAIINGRAHSDPL